MTAHTSPPDSYDLLVIGAGQAGGPLAGVMAKTRHSVAIIERKHVGGTVSECGVSGICLLIVGYASCIA